MQASNKNYDNNNNMKNTITHSFVLVQYEHFLNLPSNDKQIQYILYEHFDLPSWIVTKINTYCPGLIQTYKTNIKLNDQQQQMICVIKEKTQQQLKNSVIIILKYPQQSINDKQKCDSIRTIQQNLAYQLYLLSNDDYQLKSILSNQSIHNNSSLYKLLKQPIGILTIEFQSHLVQNINQNINSPPKRSHIQMKIIQNTYTYKINNKSYKNSLLQTIFQTYHVPFNQIIYVNTNFIPKPSAASSYLILQQTDNIPYLKPKPNNNNDKRKKYQHFNKRFTFIFRKYQKLSTLEQLKSMAHQYTEQIFIKTNQEKQIQSNINKQIFQDNNTVYNHFICVASNSFVPFLLSLSPILKKQKIINYLNHYMDITHPSYQSFFNSKKGTFYINDKKVQQIKKSLNLLLSKLILQYSKQISSLASQLSFIFEIFQLINQSILTKQFIQKLLQLFLLYGGLYPQILLSAQDWIHDLNYNDGNEQKIGNTKSYLKQKYSLNDIISAGKMTILKSKINPLLIKILQNMKSIKHDKLTFYEHFLLTKNAFTITAFDLTTKTVQFFNHVTTPQLNILDFLYMSHSFQCIQILNQWSPYKISYQTQTIFINLSQNLITAPIGVEYLQQYTDNIEICKRYFPFLIETQKQLQFNKFIFNGNKINSKQIYQERQKQFDFKHHEIISSLKKLIFSNIPKTKLIWRFIKFEASNKQIPNQKSQTMISILRKIQIINHLYNLLKTIMSHQKNLSQQVWLLNQCNFLDSVKSTKNNFIQEGQQKGIIQWEIERIKHLKNTIKTLKFKQKLINTSKMQNIQSQSHFLKVWLNILKQNLLNRVTNQYNFQDVLSEIDKIKIMQQIKQNLSGISQNFKRLQQSFSKNEYFKNIFYIFSQGVRNVNQWSEKFYSNKEVFTIIKMNKFIDQKVFSKIQKICISNINEFAQLIIQINLKEIEKILLEIEKYLTLVYNHQKVIPNNTIEAKPIWFDIQLEYQTFIKNLFNLINSSISIQAKNTLIRIYHEFGVKEFQIYDEFYSNFLMIEKKINSNLKDHQLQKLNKEILTRNKINLIIDCQGNSQLYTSLYLKLLFMKLNQIQSTKDTQLNDSDFKIQAYDFFQNQKIQLKESNFRLQKYFQSFTSSGFTSIAILELVLQNNFTNKDFGMNQILSKIISYRHLFQWKNSQQIGNVFDSFEWHILQQQRCQQYYKSVYTQEYLKSLYSKTQFSPDQIKLKFNQFHQKYRQKQKIKNQSKSPFLNKQKQIQLYLFYQILEEQCQMITKRKENNQNLQQNTQKLSIDELIDLKILYNQKVNQTYSTLQKKQLTTVFKKFMGKFGPFFEEIISVSLDNNPHSKQQWKTILLKNAISSLKLKKYLKNIFQSYNLSPNLTFQELYHLGVNRFQGQFNIILWNVRKNCIQVCNYITKPKMPLWFAILSSCSLPFYMQEQLSHKKWQVSQFSKIYPSFRQFPNRNKQALHFYQTQLNRKSSQRQSLSKSQSYKIHTQLFSSTIPDLIDQQCSKYLNPSIIQAFPLNYLTNPYFGMIRKQNAKIMTILFRKNDSGLSDRIRSNIFQQSQINVNISNVLGLYFNKKDKNVRILRQYLRKKLKQTHFYSFFKTVINKNENLFQNYKKAEKQSKNSEPSQETRKISYDVTSSDEKTPTNKPDGQDKLHQKMNGYKQKNTLNVKLQKIQIQKVQYVSDEAKNDRNSKTSHHSYKFFTTFSEINRQKQVQLPQLSSKQLMLDFQDRIQSPTLQAIRAKSNKQTDLSQRKQQKLKPKQRRIKKFFKKYIVNCKCFGFRPTHRKKQQYKNNQY